MRDVIYECPLIFNMTIESHWVGKKCRQQKEIWNRNFKISLFNFSFVPKLFCPRKITLKEKVSAIAHQNILVQISRTDKNSMLVEKNCNRARWISNKYWRVGVTSQVLLARQDLECWYRQQKEVIPMSKYKEWYKGSVYLFDNIEQWLSLEILAQVWSQPYFKDT